MLTQFSAENAENARIANGLLFGIENALKARKGNFRALTASSIIRKHARAEADPRLRAVAAPAFAQIARVMTAFRPKSTRYLFLEGSYGFRSDLFSIARALVRHAEESRKPNGERLAEYTDAAFPNLKQRIVSSAPIFPVLDKATLAFTLTKLRENLGPDDAFVRRIFGAKSPRQLAEELIDGSRLADLATRKSLLDADPAAIAASTDSMIAFALAVDGDSRAIRKEYEESVEAPLEKAHAQIARARFKLEGTSVYPDATFTLRISYGSVQGYRQESGWVDPITRIGGAFARATGAPPFALPASWLAAQDKLDPAAAFDIATTNDIIGGNSGSPVINAKAEVVGLVFDGNIQSLGGDYGYDSAENRAVSVSTTALRTALETVYHADRIVAELKQ
jgi:hypothetical protein